MKTRLTLKPGQKGTGKLAQLYGDRLFRVRYRYDKKTGKRLKTVELIVEETGREPPENGISGDKTVGIRADCGEKDLQNRVRKAGWVWNREQKLWHLRYDRVEEPGLKDSDHSDRHSGKIVKPDLFLTVRRQVIKTYSTIYLMDLWESIQNYMLWGFAYNTIY